VVHWLAHRTPIFKLEDEDIGAQVITIVKLKEVAVTISEVDETPILD
jgi:hypothetical protein